MIWYSHFFQDLPQFIEIHTVKGFGTVNKAEIDVFFWNSLAFSIKPIEEYKGGTLFDINCIKILFDPPPRIMK